MKLTTEERFLAKVSRDEATGCWIWTGYRMPEGYGQMKVGGRAGRVLLAHRWAYEHFVGPIPAGYQLDHFACDNGAGGCVNPAHVRPVTPRENTLRSRSIAAQHLAQVECIHGHPLSGSNVYVFRNGARKCKTCRRLGEQRRRAAS